MAEQVQLDPALPPFAVRLDRKALVARMRGLGLSLQRLAVVAEVPKRAVRAVLYRDGLVTLSVAQRLAEGLGVTAEQLTTKKESPK